MSRPLLTLDGCKVRYGAVVALNDASLQLQDGEAVGIVGALGSGKTTLLRLVVGLAEAEHGTVCFEERDLHGTGTDARARHGIIHVPAGGGIFPSLSVRENLVLAQPRAGTQAEIDSMTQRFPVLGERLQQRAGSLSGGEQRQLAIARGVLARPRLLLLDEPLLGLSPTTVQRVVGLLTALRDAGIAMIVVEERPTDELQSLVHRLVGMRAGRVVAPQETARIPEPRAGAGGSLDRVDVEMVGLPLSVRDRRALQTIAQQRGQPVGEVIADLVHQHVEQREEVWQ